MKVALVYDRVNKWGGAERVILALQRIFPEASLYTSVYNKDKAPWANKLSIKHSFLQSIPFASSSHEYLAPLMPIAFESFRFDEYDLVISVTSESAKGIITKPGTIHISYCLTPTRYLWSGYKDYFRNSTLEFLSRPAVSYLKFWDRIASNRPDQYIAISYEIQKRIKKYYKRDSVVVYPPLSLKNKNSKKVNEEDYFLVVSRLANYYKRIDIAIQACNSLNLPLKIIGTGKDENRLKKIAGPSIEFLGYLPDEELSGYYQNCKALIFPGIEDFGLTMVEAQHFGKPVIAFRGGGALEIVKEGLTGEFFNKPNVKSLASVLENFDNSRYNIDLCKENADRFSFANFKKQILTVVQKNLNKL